MSLRDDDDVPAVVGSITGTFSQTYRALFPILYDLKAEPMNLWLLLIWRTISYRFGVNHNAAEITKSICCVEGSGSLDFCSLSKWLNTFYSACNNLNDWTMSAGIKTMNSKALTPIKW